jgi:hypothetical protein
MGQGYAFHPRGVDDLAQRLRRVDRRTTAIRSAGNATAPPTIVTGAATGIKVTVPGLTTGTTVDNGPKIQAVLDGLASSSFYDHSKTVWVEGPFGQPVWINSSVNVETSQINLHFASTVLFGPYGRVRIQGEVAELPEFGKPILKADYTAGSTALVVSDTSLFAANDYVLIRGSRGATGDPISTQKEFGYIASVDSPTELTLVEGFDNDYLKLNANPDSPIGTSPESQLTKVVAANLTTDAARGDRTLEVDDTSIFVVGDTVQIMDDARTTNSTTGLPEDDNYIHREMGQIAEIVDGTHLRLTKALHHPCEVAAFGKVILLRPVRGSSITGARCRWTEMSEVGVAFEIRYGIDCLMSGLSVTGTEVGSEGRALKSWLNQAFRITDSLRCRTSFCKASRPADTGSGRGYGFTLYGSNECWIDHCEGSSLRHTVLLFNAAAGNTVHDIISEDCCLSDVDVHGCGCSDNLFHDIVCIGGESLASNGDSNRAALRIGNTAHADGDYFNTFDGVVAYGYHDGAAVDFVAQSHDNIVRNVTAINCQKGIRARPTPADTTLEIARNVVDGLTTIDVDQISDIDGGTNVIVKGLTIKNSTFIGATDDIRIEQAERVTLLRCDWVEPAQPSGTYAVWATESPSFAMRYCDLSGSQRGVKLGDCPDSRIVFNTMHDFVLTVVLDDSPGGNDDSVFRRNDFAGFTPTVTGSGTSTGFTPDLTT